MSDANRRTEGYFVEVREDDVGCWDLVVYTFSSLTTGTTEYELATVRGKRKLLCAQIYKNVLGRIGSFNGWAPNKYLYFESLEDFKKTLIERAEAVGFVDREAGWSVQQRADHLKEEVFEEDLTYRVAHKPGFFTGFTATSE